MPTRPLQIFIVDDSAEDRMLYRRELTKNDSDTYSIIEAETGQEGLEHLKQECPDCILLDYSLPDLNGIEFLDAIASFQLKKRPAVVMLTGQGNEKIAVAAMKRGAQDYILKADVNSEKLQRAIRHAVEKVALENEILTKQQDLESSNYELERASRVKDEFLAKMSHELRTPLNSIIGFTEMMIQDTKDPPVGKRITRLEKVHRNSQNLLALINDILDISKIEANQLTLAQEVVDVAELVKECVDLAEPLVNPTNVDLQHHIDESLSGHPHWIGDPQRLQQIILNLLSNAAKFTNQGHIAVRVSVDNDTLAIEVEDTGIGIPSEHLPNIFDDFHQVDSSTTRRAGGTGLGLSICHKLCQLMGGIITAKSKRDEGSIFSIRMPFIDAAANTACIIQSSVLYAGTQTSAHQIKQMTHGLAAPVRCVSDMKLAVEYCQHCSPGKLFIDPFWKNALQFLEIIKRHNATTQIPVELLSVMDDKSARIAFDDYIIQPLGSDTLHRILCGSSDNSSSRVMFFSGQNPDDRFLQEMLVEFPDIDATIVSNLEEANGQLDSKPFDVLIVDPLDMRGEGFELAARQSTLMTSARYRLISVIPRDPSSEHILALSRAFQLYMARHSETADQILNHFNSNTETSKESQKAMCVTP